MKDAKTITEFVKNVCFHYSICYSAYFCDYDENDQHVPAPIFEDDFVTPGKLNYLSKLLGMSTEDIANADNKASMSNKKYDLELAHTFSNNHKKALSVEQRCGCFYCQSIFSSKEILDWLEDDNPCDRLGSLVC